MYPLALAAHFFFGAADSANAVMASFVAEPEPESLLSITDSPLTAQGDVPFSLETTLPDTGDQVAPLSLTRNTYARTGWQAVLSTFAHGVRGTVTIVDADTFRVDNFYYDGGGINVHFILAASNDNNVFRTTRYVTSLNLLGTAYNGGSLEISLPSGNTLDGYNAISLWCIPAQANFGSGTFVNPVPEPASVGMLAFGAVLLGLVRRRSRQ
jgi:hypothetical protein